MIARLSLLEQLRGLIERTYAIETGLADIGRFVVGNAGYRRFYSDSRPRTSVPTASAGARMLVREAPDALRASIYYPDELIEALEIDPPQRGLNDRNVDAFSTLVEELDHLLLLVWRMRQERSVSLFELELQANVTKHLVLARFLAKGRPQLAAGEQLWLRHHLYGKADFDDADPAVAERYRMAQRCGVRFLDRLPRTPARRLAMLRRFHSADAAGKLEIIEVRSAS